ncbi:MAG: UDP-N-acetylmuramate--L-alanine ligase [Coprothermobacterota bacterium]|nr:UDP-N-acetylmuramate--L-alanine ligase [Coprothermobacterota bacterium]
MKTTGRLHLLGIGGAGMSALALLLRSRGTDVSGADPAISPALAAKMTGEGIVVYRTHDPSHLDGVERVVISSAIPEENPELREALRRSIPIAHRVDLLCRLAEGKQLTAVAGTHGKGTITGMLAYLLRRLGWDPSLANGAELVDDGRTPCRGLSCWWGEGAHFVMETDESDGSFLKLLPRTALITNIDRDHLDFWGDEEGLRQGFRRFAGAVEGILILHESLLDLLEEQVRPVWSYGKGADCRFRLMEWQPLEGGAEVTADTPNGTLHFSICLFGEHNALNALGAIAVAASLGVSPERAAWALSSYRGIRRRLERKGETGGVLVFDDHADHPTEIAGAIAALLPLGRPIVAVLQPHRFSRVRSLLADYGPALAQAQRVVVLPIWAAGEKIDYQLSDQDLYLQICQSNPGQEVHFSPRDTLLSFLRTTLRRGEVLLLMGPGDIAEVAERWEEISA